MRWTDISECLTGLVLTGKIHADYIIPTYLAPPYDLIISKAKEGKTPAQILDIVGLMPINAARQAAEQIDYNETTLEELLTTLMSAYRRQEQSKVLKEQVKLLDKGENLEIDKISLLLEKTEDYKGKYIRLSEVDATTPVWRKSFYPPIDEHLGDPEDMSMVGVPESGLVIIAGPTGQGKSSLMASIIAGMAAEKKTTLVYTLEMTTGQIAKRIIQVAIDGLSTEQKRTVIICNEIMSADEVYADAMRLCATEGVYSIFIDFSDLLIEKEQDEQSMAHVYRQCAKLAKKNLSGAPVFLLSQLNRSVYTGTGGIPKINQLRWSGLAEAMGALIILIYNPNQTFATQTKDDSLPTVSGRAYLLAAKSRFGFKEGNPGAIQVDFDGKTSWGRESYGYFNLLSV